MQRVQGVEEEEVRRGIQGERSGEKEGRAGGYLEVYVVAMSQLRGTGENEMS